jgi:hypothetical protein
MALNSAAISAAIAATSISGVTVKDVTGIPQDVFDRDCPILFPQPGSWLDGGSATTNKENTFGTASTRMWIFHRSFKYVFLHSAIGAGRGNLDNYADAVTKLEAIVSALIALDISDADVEDVTHTPIGVMTGPSSNKFTGCEVTISIREKVNA